MSRPIARTALAGVALAVGALFALPSAAEEVSSEAATVAATIAAPVGTRVAHIGYVVPNVRKAMEKAAADLGIDPANARYSKVSVDHARYFGKDTSFSAEYAMITVGGAQLEFIAPIAGQSPYADALFDARHKDGTAHHVAFTVASIDARLAEMRKNHPRMLVVLDAAMPGGQRFVYLENVLPHLMVELIEGGAAR